MSPATLVGFAVLSLFGVALSALCSGIETGVYSLNRVRLALGVGRGERRALLLREEMDHPNRLLAALLIANTLANDLVAIGTSHLFDALSLGPITAVVLNTVVLVPVLFILGDVVPKDLFRRIADRSILTMAPWIRAGRLLLTWTGLVPLVQVVSSFVLKRLGARAEEPLSSRQRLARLFEEGAGSGVLTEAQVTLAERVMGVAGRTVSERMIPWRRVVTMRADMDSAGRRAALRGRNFSRFPVVDSKGAVKGVATALDMALRLDRPIAEMCVAPCLVGASTSLLVALETMRRSRAKLAIVGDSASLPLGVITLNDLVQPLVGSFEGEL